MSPILEDSLRNILELILPFGPLIEKSAQTYERS